MSQYVFGSGRLFAVPSGTNTPAEFGTLQDVTLNVTFTNKELQGQYQFPVAIGRGPAKIDGDAKAANFNALAFNSIFFGGTVATGSTLTASETNAIPGTPYQITVTNSATWTRDLQVYDNTAGIFLTKVASSPSTGEYSVAAGVYTFAAADTTNSITITYAYTSASSGKSSVISNQLMGTTPTFAMVLSNAAYQGKNLTIELYAVTSMSLKMDFKNGDWAIPDFTFQAFTDSSNQLGKWSYAE